MGKLAGLIPASLLEMAHLWLHLLPVLLPAVLLVLDLLLPVLLELALLLPVLLDLALLLPVLPTQLDPDTRMEELTASPRQEPALLASSSRRGPLPITITAMCDFYRSCEVYSKRKYICKLMTYKGFCFLWILM